jgi:membrane protein
MSPSLFDRYLKLVKYLTLDIWVKEYDALSRLRRWLLRLLQVAYMVVRGFFKDSCPLRSSALTYATLLSIVPLLAFSFALARAFGVDLTPLKSFIINNITLGNEEIGTRIFDFVENIRAGTLGPPALALLVVTIISVMGNIEFSFNHIWGIRKSRSIWRKFSDYLSVIIVVPLLITAGVGIAAVLRSHAMVETVFQFHFIQNLFWHSVNRLLVCVGFTFLYLFMPNKRIRFTAALLGGLVAGLLWQAALWGYITFQVGFVRYAAIYGALASIPINLVWIYISWNIVLLGAEISFAVQNVRTFSGEEEALSRSWAYRELVAVNLLVRIAERFQKGGKAPVPEELAEGLEVPIRLVNQTLEQMTRGGVVSEVAGERPGYQPARDLEQLTLEEVIDSLRQAGGPEKVSPALLKSPVVRRIEEIVDRSLSEHGGSLTIGELLAPAD